MSNPAPERPAQLEGIRTIRVDERRKLDLKRYRLRHAREEDVDEVVREPFLLYEGDTLLVAYFELARDPDADATLTALWRQLPRIHYEVSFRSGGLKTTSRTFGFLPRVAMRRDFCTATTLAASQPAAHNAIAAGANLIARYYRAVNPELFDVHHTEAERVLPDFQLEGGPFTSGIVNHNNPLRYHFDAGNFRRVWSGMLGFKRYAGGGFLAMPEFGIAAEVADRSLLMFDGQGILHGVTPIRPFKPYYKRFTIVYYSMAGMWNCDPLGTEVERIRRVKTQREYKRAGREPAQVQGGS